MWCAAKHERSKRSNFLSDIALREVADSCRRGSAAVVVDGERRDSFFDLSNGSRNAGFVEVKSEPLH